MKSRFDLLITILINYIDYRTVYCQNKYTFSKLQDFVVSLTFFPTKRRRNRSLENVYVHNVFVHIHLLYS